MKSNKANGPPGVEVKHSSDTVKKGLVWKGW